jgi:hypothetical protein
LSTPKHLPSELSFLTGSPKAKPQLEIGKLVPPEEPKKSFRSSPITVSMQELGSSSTTVLWQSAEVEDVVYACIDLILFHMVGRGVHDPKQ